MEVKMFNDGKSTWLALLAIFCLLLTLFLIVATIILALIPIYLSVKGSSAVKTYTFYAGYSTNLINGRSRILANTNSVSTQLAQQTGLSTSVFNLQSAGFASSTSTSRRKRQTINGNSICENGTNSVLLGDIFLPQIQITYPSLCLSRNCRRKYLSSIQNNFRRNYTIFTISMTFTDGETLNVAMMFCNFFSISATRCTAETTNYIYFIDSNILYQYNPKIYKIIQIDTINCSTSQYIYSSALQQNGLLWLLYYDGKLYTYNIKTAQCANTTFVKNQTGILYFDMTFVKDNSRVGETLYISDYYPGNTLGKIDASTLIMSTVGNYTNGTFPELKGTNDGKLYGLFFYEPFVIRQLSTTNAQTLNQYQVTQLLDENIFGFTYVPYKSKFLFFTRYEKYTAVSIYDPSTNTTTNQTTLSQTDLNRAIVSTCFNP